MPDSKKPPAQKAPGHLRLVHRPVRQLAAPPTGQLPLFQPDSNAVLAVFNMAAVSAVIFCDMLATMRPHWLIDMRPVPNFDFDSLSRRAAFSFFERRNIQYRDLAAVLGITSRRDASLTAGLISEHFRTMVRQERRASVGPVAVLLDDRSTLVASARILRDTLEPRPKGGWRLQVVPRIELERVT